MRYTVRGFYETGNSFGSHDTDDTLALSWENKELARQAMKEIKDHYNYSQEKYDSGIADKCSEEPWWSDDYSEFCLMLEKDNGERTRVSVPWTGFFERLFRLEIVSAYNGEDEDTLFV